MRRNSRRAARCRSATLRHWVGSASTPRRTSGVLGEHPVNHLLLMPQFGRSAVAVEGSRGLLQPMPGGGRCLGLGGTLGYAVACCCSGQTRPADGRGPALVHQVDADGQATAASAAVIRTERRPMAEECLSAEATGSDQACRKVLRSWKSARVSPWRRAQ
ncbi:MAG: hypothetical protein CM15mP77_0440 [Synechococcus sp.]|nr:MAG: hypothetical protein CM15mP77_0440 [Synechococcus sp.]